MCIGTEAGGSRAVCVEWGVGERGEGERQVPEVRSLPMPSLGSGAERVVPGQSGDLRCNNQGASQLWPLTIYSQCLTFPSDSPFLLGKEAAGCHVVSQ